MNKITISILTLIFIFFGSSCVNNTKEKSEQPRNEDIKEEQITFDESEGIASTSKNLYFVFDGSGSMKENCSGRKKIDGARMAINTFLSKVPENINIGLAIFGVKDNKYGIKEVVPLGIDNRNDFKDAINGVNPDGGTPLHNATNLGLVKLVEQYKKQLGYGEYRLIIVTDGMASDESLFKSALIRSIRYPFISIYGIGLCINGNHLLKTYSIAYYDAQNYEELGAALEETSAELNVFDPESFNLDDLIDEANVN